MNQPVTNYISILNSLKEKIRQARYNASVVVNVALLKLYWEIGNTILEQQKLEGWGTKVIDRLAIDLRVEFSDFKGLSVRNLKYMRAFAEAYPEFGFVQTPSAQLKNTDIQPVEIVQTLSAQLPWSHHQLLLDKIKDIQERLFYIQKSIENGWSRNILAEQISTKLYERQGKAITNFITTLPQIQSDLAQQTLKNPYVFDFLSYGEEIKELELERGLIQHLKKFMLELGKGFAYVGNQKNITVENDEFFLDLLFYNYNMHCFVVFELKIGDFKPEYAGKLNFYVNTVNDQYRGIDDKRTIGVLLCKTPNETVVRYSLQGIESPIGVADYKLIQSLPKQIKSEIPSIEELEAEIDKSYEELKSPTEKRFDSLKQKIEELKKEEIKTPATLPILYDLFDKSILPLYIKLLEKLKMFDEMFVAANYHWAGPQYNSPRLEDNKPLVTGSITDLNVWADYWKDEKFIIANTEHNFHYRFHGFKKAGTDPFDISFQLNYYVNTYWYGFSLINFNKSWPFLKKLYHEQLTPKDIEQICATVNDHLMDSIENSLEWIKKNN